MSYSIRENLQRRRRQVLIDLTTSQTIPFTLDPNSKNTAGVYSPILQHGNRHLIQTDSELPPRCYVWPDSGAEGTRVASKDAFILGGCAVSEIDNKLQEHVERYPLVSLDCAKIFRSEHISDFRVGMTAWLNLRINGVIFDIDLMRKHAAIRDQRDCDEFDGEVLIHLEEFTQWEFFPYAVTALRLPVDLAAVKASAPILWLTPAEVVERGLRAVARERLRKGAEAAQ